MKKQYRFMVEQAPQAIMILKRLAFKFLNIDNKYDLTTEGGHSSNRVAHVADKTGQSIQVNLLAQAKKHKNIKLFEEYVAVDLVVKDNKCLWRICLR